MKKIAIVFSLLIIATAMNFAQAQNQNNVSPSPGAPPVKHTEQKEYSMINGERVFMKADVMPSFPGGENAFSEYLKTNLKYPEQAKSSKVFGRVYVSFTIGRDGTVKNVTLLRGIGSGCDEEALRVINLMPKWNPGQKDGRAVAVQYNLPINFTLGEEKQK